MQDKVKRPAIALLVLAGINALISAWGLLQGALGGMQKDKIVDQLTSMGLSPEQAQQFAGIATSLGIAMPIVQLLVSVFAIWAATRMMKLTGWGAAVTASILVMLPVITPCVCCVPGLGIGIWSLVTLFNADVKRAFEGQPPPL